MHRGMASVTGALRICDKFVHRTNAPHENATRRTPVGIAAGARGNDATTRIIDGLGFTLDSHRVIERTDTRGALVNHPVEAGRAAPYIPLPSTDFVTSRLLRHTCRHLPDVVAVTTTCVLFDDTILFRTATAI